MTGPLHGLIGCTCPGCMADPPGICPCIGGWADLVDGVTTECGGLARKYQIKDYSPTFFDHTGCSGLTHATQDWGGVMQATYEPVTPGGTSNICYWQPDSVHETHGITASRFDIREDYSYLSHEGTQGWSMVLRTDHDVIWSGVKDTGPSPHGRYEADGESDCNQELSLEMVPYTS